VCSAARNAPEMTSKEAWSAKKRARQWKKSRKFGVTRTKKLRYVDESVEFDLFRVSLRQSDLRTRSEVAASCMTLYS